MGRLLLARTLRIVLEGPVSITREPMGTTELIYYAFAALLIAAVLIPFIKSDRWMVRILDYPRYQKFALILLLAAVWPFAIVDPGVVGHVVLGLLLLAAVYLGYIMFPYTPLSTPMIEQVALREGEQPLRLLICNVLQDNSAYHRMSALITAKRPDVIFLLETDLAWKNALAEVVADYPHRIEVPQENTYGLLFYSKLALLHHEVNYLIDKEVPSIVADIEYAGEPVRLYGLHPTPPVPQENTKSTERDAEVLMIGKSAEAHGKPCIVFGDLNDVAWSRTTKLFLKASKMLDPRRGRGMYNTFHVDYPFLRWPLDHVFLSSHFRLVEMHIERSVGSDHFPVYISVVRRSDDAEGELEIDGKEQQEVREKISAGVEEGG